MAKGVPIYKLTQPDKPLRDSAPVVLVRLQEMYDWAPSIRDPQNVEELHNMRIAAKRLRYTMEVFAPVLGKDFAGALKTVEDIQERIGAIHDADVLVPLLEATLEKETERERKKALKKRGGGPPRFSAAEGLAPLIARRRQERERLYHDFIAFWDALPPEAFFARVQNILQPGTAAPVATTPAPSAAPVANAGPAAANDRDDVAENNLVKSALGETGATAESIAAAAPDPASVAAFQEPPTPEADEEAAHALAGLPADTPDAAAEAPDDA